MKAKAKKATRKASGYVRKGRDIALHRIQRHFPHVKTVQDADEGLLINVTEGDNTNSTPDDPENCAMAKAVKREKVADGAIIGIAYSWLIKGTKAVRYKTSEAVGREITSFDRHHDFATGQNYRLSPISPASRLGVRQREPGPHNPDATPLTPRTIHKTARIRALWKK